MGGTTDPKMPKVKLPPRDAIRYTWLLTSSFYENDPFRKEFHEIIKSQFNGLIRHVKYNVEISSKEKKYTDDAHFAIQLAIYKIYILFLKRNINFKENSKLRKAYLGAIEDKISFGTDLKDSLKAIPTIAITSATGMTLLFVSEKYGVLKLSNISSIAISGFFVILGYLIYWILLNRSSKKALICYIQREYEGSMYFSSYIFEVRDILKRLYVEIEGIHKREFDKYSGEGINEKNLESESGKVIDRVLKLDDMITRPCKYADDDLFKNKISPEFWALCETGFIYGLNTFREDICPKSNGRYDSEPRFICPNYNLKKWETFQNVISDYFSEWGGLIIILIHILIPFIVLIGVSILVLQ
ncbi:MAG: hypothetical protein PHP59_08290 [Methanofollis sp.]|uniref:hypothetical protein n=1 Tax=Methanofollis sp. TaxID=2052835 RepID=UPI0026372A0F|nr:hypothetical protein [Methanofollis sp.]MDD4255358.1 hypothetical protein [Methanofollis sp.]